MTGRRCRWGVQRRQYGAEAVQCDGEVGKLAFLSIRDDRSQMQVRHEGAVQGVGQYIVWAVGTN